MTMNFDHHGAAGTATAIGDEHEEPPLRILLADDRLGYDRFGLHGGGRLMLAWTRALLARGVDVTTVILRGSRTFRALVEAEGLPIIFLDRAEFDPRTYGDFLSLIDERGIELLHLQGHGASTFGRLAALRRGLPVVAHTHADYRHSPKGYPWYVRAVDRLLAPGTARALAVSRVTRQFAIDERGFSPDRIEVFPNAVDHSSFRRPTAVQRREMRRRLGIADETPVAVTVGRLDRTKGVDLQVDAWDEVARAVPEALLLVAGDGPDRPALEQRVAARGRQRSIRFLGWRADVEQLLWAADFGVISSRDEGLPLAVLEAMATGLPVVGTDVGGIPDVIRHDVNGILVPPEDASALAHGVIALASDVGLRRRLAAGAVETSADFALPAVAEHLEAVYRSTIAAWRSSRQRVPAPGDRLAVRAVP